MKTEWNSSTIVAGRYKIRRLVGRGGMGSVYEAFDQHLEKTVAIKVLLGEIEPTRAQRFQLEATAAGRLKHKNIVTVMDFGLTDTNQMYMVSEFVHGSTLAERVKISGPLSVNEFRSIFIQICHGMQHAHDAGIVHRDLKPENIIVVNEADGLVVKIVDFGLAKFLDLDASLTRTGASMGSPYYMSPEQVIAGDIDHRADIYSLGCVMFFCLEGKPPFKGSTALETMQMHRVDRFPSLTKLDADTEHGAIISSMISGCIEKDAENRLSSMSKLLEILESVEPLEEKAEDVSGEQEPVETEVAQPRKEVKRITIATLAVASLLLLMTACVIYSFASKFIATAVSPPVAPRAEERENSASLEAEVRLAPLDFTLLPGTIDSKRTGTPSKGKFGEQGRGLWLNTEDVTADDVREFFKAKGQRKILKLQISEQHLTPDLIDVLVKSNLRFLELRNVTFEPGGLSELQKMRSLVSLRLGLQNCADFEFVSELDQLQDLYFDGSSLRETTPFVIPRLPKKICSVGFYRFRFGVSQDSFEKLKTFPRLTQIDLFEVKRMDEPRLASQLSSFKQLNCLVIKRVFFKEPPKISGLNLKMLVIMYEPIWTVKSITKILRENKVREFIIAESHVGETFDNVEYLFAIVPSLQVVRDVRGKHYRERVGGK